MAKVHRSRSKSGATMVRVVEYAGGGRERFLKYIGSARTEADLAVLMDRAHAWLAEHSGQGELDLGVEIPRRKVELLAPAKSATLFGSGREAARLVSPGRVRATRSLLLAELLVGVYRDLGFELLADDRFRDLVVAWVARPRSIAKTGKTRARLGLDPASDSTRRRALRRARNCSAPGRLSGLWLRFD